LNVFRGRVPLSLGGRETCLVLGPVSPDALAFIFYPEWRKAMLIKEARELLAEIGVEPRPALVDNLRRMRNRKAAVGILTFMRERYPQLRRAPFSPDGREPPKDAKEFLARLFT
jgi:hypothetical protein